MKNEKNKRLRYYLNRAFNPVYNPWMYISIIIFDTCIRIFNSNVLELNDKLIIESIFLLALILTLKFFQDMFFNKNMEWN